MFNNWFTKEKPFISGTTTTGGSGGFGVSKSGASGGGWPFDLDNLRFNGKRISYNNYPTTNNTSNLYGMFLKPDGTALYTIQRNDGEKIRRHNMSTAFDIDTCSYDSISSTALDTPNALFPVGLEFKSDGTRVFYLDGYSSSASILRSYNLFTAWDITGTMTQTNDSFDVHSAVSGISSSGIQSFTFKPDGTKLWIVATSSTASSDSIIFEFTLSTAWDLTTVSLSQSNTTTFTGFSYGYLTGLTWKPDGTRYYTISHGNTRIIRYDCTTPWDISASNYTGRVSDAYYQIVSGFNVRGNTIQLKSDGTVGYISDAFTEDIYQLNLHNPWDTNGVLYSPNDIDHINDNEYTDLIHIYKKIQRQSLYGSKWNPDGTKLYLSPSGSGVVEYSVSTPYDFKSTWTSTGKALPNTGLGYGIFEINYSSDGTRFLLMELQNRIVKQYNLSTGFDLDTETDANADLDLLSGSGETSVTGGTISDNGRYIYMCRTNGNVHQWTLSTPWELSTASYTRVATFSGGASRMKISPDGTQIVTYRSQSGFVTFKTFTLSTAWDISTATLDKTKDLASINMPGPLTASSPSWNIHDDQWDFFSYYASFGYRLYC